MDGSSDSRYVTAPTVLTEYATTRASPLSDRARSGSSMEGTASGKCTSVEDEIKRSKSHWSEVVKSDPNITDNEEVADNVEVFKALQSHTTWGAFFKTFGYHSGTPIAGRPGLIRGSQGELEIGEKSAEGGQAGLDHLPGSPGGAQSGMRSI